MHSHIDHLFALVRAFKALKVPKVFIHFFADGRDTSPTSGGIKIVFIERTFEY